MFTKLLLSLVLAFLVGMSACFAECVEDFRPVSLGGGGSVQVKGYVCRDAGAHAKVEFHRFTGGAASLLMSGLKSDVVPEFVGADRVIATPVSALLTDLLDRFGETYELSDGWYADFMVAVPRGGIAELSFAAIEGQSVRFFDTDVGALDPHFYYPAVEEITQLERGTMPSSVSSIDGNTVWRFMTKTDLDEYEARRAEFGRLFDADEENYNYSFYTDSTIGLFAYLARQGLPSDFSVIIGRRLDGGCAFSGVNWIFNYLQRIPIMDGVIIENLSNATMSVDSLTGRRTEGGLRRPDSKATGGGAIIDLDIALEPGERVLVPTRLIFAPSDELREFSSTSYVYGSAFDIAGMIVEGSRMDFEERSANFMQISLNIEAGSCPYLLSQKDGQWLNNGKVLHKAYGAENEYQEIVEFVGFRDTFRLEEREPEVAYLDEAVLVVRLNNGRRLELLSDWKPFAEVDEERTVLGWADAIEFTFSLPPGIDPEQVEMSESRVTGYYERYSAMPMLSQREGSVGLEEIGYSEAEACPIPN